MRIIAIIGEPGVGKTFLMRKVYERLQRLLDDHTGTAGKYGKLEYTRVGRIAILGKGYASASEVFAGTDKLSMSVITDAVPFLQEAPGLNIAAVAFEGDRLANARFFNACKAAGDFRLIVAKAAEPLLRARRLAREERYGKAQDATWLAGRASKVITLEQQFAGAPVYIDNDGRQEVISAAIVDYLCTGDARFLPCASSQRLI